MQVNLTVIDGHSLSVVALSLGKSFLLSQVLFEEGELLVADRLSFLNHIPLDTLGTRRGSKRAVIAVIVAKVYSFQQPDDVNLSIGGAISLLDGFDDRFKERILIFTAFFLIEKHSNDGAQASIHLI